MVSYEGTKGHLTVRVLRTGLNFPLRDSTKLITSLYLVTYILGVDCIDYPKIH